MTAVGSYLPANVVTNDDLSACVETSDEWIRRRTGITQRHFVADGETTADLASNAATKALAQAGLAPTDIDLIIVATTTPDNTFPSTATKVQHLIGASGAIAFDVQAVCAGFIYAVDVADAMLRGGRGRRALVIGAESFSKLLDWQDRTTCVLCGDGAGAVILEIVDGDSDFGIRSSVLHADGAYRDILYVDGGPSSNQDVGHVRMEGKEVFRHAIEKLASVMDEALAKADMHPHDIDWLVPHQANLRIIDATARRMGLGTEKVMININKYGNTTAGTIPLCLYDWKDQLSNGDGLILTAFGGGFTWGSVYLKWAYDSEG